MKEKNEFIQDCVDRVTYGDMNFKMLIQMLFAVMKCMLSNVTREILEKAD